MPDARHLLTLQISEPLDTGTVAVLGGERLGACTTDAELAVGWNELSVAILGPGGGALLPVAAALEIDDYWARRRCRARLYAEGETVFDGRVVDCELSGYVRDPLLGLACTVTLTIAGLARTELTGAVPDLPDDFTDEGATVTQSTLLRHLVTELASQGSAIAAEFAQVEETSVNVGPIDDGDQDTPLSLVQGGNRVGEAGTDAETAFMVYEGERGPILKALRDDGSDPAVWAFSVAGSALKRVRKGDEFATAVRAIATGDDGSETTELVSDAAALSRVGGIQRVRTITVDRVGADGGASAARKALALKANPVGWQGEYRLQPVAGWSIPPIRNAEGALEPGWRVRAGDLVRLLDALPDDPESPDGPGGELAFVRSVKVDWVQGTVSLSLDHRRVTARAGEDMLKATRERGAIEPGASGTVWLSAATTGANTNIGSTAGVVTNIGESGYLTFRAPKTGTYTIEMHSYWTTAANTGRICVGYDLDGEGFDPAAHSDRTARIRADAASSTQRTVSGTFKRRMKRGEHRIGVWAEDSTSSELTYLLIRIIR